MRMLVLSRKRDEALVIGTGAEIKIFVVDIRGDKVRLGIESPRDVPVHRLEVWDAIQGHRFAQERDAAEKKALGGGD